MHIVNDIKWFKKETFRSVNNYSININTINNSTTFEIKNRDIVQVVFQSLNRFPITVLFSDVAYIP